jgi:hypothetical protein
MKLHDFINLWDTYRHNKVGETSFEDFMTWIRFKDTTPNPYRYSHDETHVQGRRITCLSLSQAREIMGDLIGEDVKPRLAKVPQMVNGSLTNIDADYFKDLGANQLRAELRTKLAKRFKELRGDLDD